MAALCRSIIVFSSVFACLTVSGCVRFRDSTLQRYQAGGMIPAVPPITVQFDAHAIMPVPERYERVNRHRVEMREQLVKESDRLFSQAGIHLIDDASADLRIIATLYVYPDTLRSLPFGYYIDFSSLTCLILPIHEQQAWVLGVDVEKGGQSLKQYQYRQVIHTWAQLFLLFGMPFFDEYADLQRKTIDDLLFNFIVDFQKDYAHVSMKQHSDGSS